MSNSDKEKLKHVNDKLITKTKIFNSNKLKKTEKNLTLMTTNTVQIKMTYKRKKNDKIVNKSFNLIDWNCNSLNNKIEEFKSFCFKFNPEIISLNETKMSEFNAKYILNINNYTTIHKSRNNDKNGAGGVALLIRNDIKFSESSLLESLNQELIAINTINNGKETCIIAYYNPPNLKIDEKIFDILKNESNGRFKR